MVLKKTLESPLDCKEIKPVHPKKKSVLSIHWEDYAEAEAQIISPPDGKNWLIGKDPDVGNIEGRKRRGRQDEMVGWHHQVDGHEHE